MTVGSARGRRRTGAPRRNIIETWLQATYRAHIAQQRYGGWTVVAQVRRLNADLNTAYHQGRFSQWRYGTTELPMRVYYYLLSHGALEEALLQHGTAASQSSRLLEALAPPLTRNRRRKPPPAE